MTKPEWGSKRNCQACGTKFYDMKRDPAVCPSCGTAFDPNVSQRARRSRVTAAATKAPPAKPKAEREEIVDMDDDDLDVMVDDEDDDMLVDAEDLDADGEDDDIPGVSVGGEDDENS